MFSNQFLMYPSTFTNNMIVTFPYRIPANANPTEHRVRKWKFGIRNKISRERDEIN